jgi:hypothetical protein
LLYLDLLFQNMKISIRCACIVTLLVASSCSEDEGIKPGRETYVAISWADQTLSTIFASPPNSPTYSSRSLAYLGVTMYECVVHGSAVHNTLAGQLNQLDALPQPEPGVEYNWPLSLNAGQAFMLKALYPHAPSKTVVKINFLETRNKLVLAQGLDPHVVDRSIAFGQAVASAVFEWSKTDGGHEGYLRNFDPTYVIPGGDGFWVPPFAGQSASPFPLHPYWGSNRTFVAENSSLSVPVMLPYSADPSSEYYGQFKDVYDKRNSLTQQEKDIAAWWADDPTQTSSPPGHSYNLATISIESSGSDMFTAAEVYAKVGIAVGDAFITCWKCKYVYHAERPFNYIRQHINEGYVQFWPEPPFPAFSSGHATQSAAAAIVMEGIFGTQFKLVDNTYQNRAPDFDGILYRNRTFQSIWETAEECANSRFYGGIHTPQDNEEGQKQGILIGQNISAIAWRK